jgi:S1-C subfamily serine protease
MIKTLLRSVASQLLLVVVSGISAGVAQELPLDEKTTSLGKQYTGIVRIENASIVPDFATPWNAGLPRGGSGTGFLIGDNLFMTNAHVVSDSNRVIIKKVGDSEPLLARILHVAHDCDLAVLELEDPSKFKDVDPLEIGDDIPKLDTAVKVVGYPIGGERISVTRGVVSRIDFLAYSHSAVDYHLTVQIDAAINPGNSGGPVIQDGKVAGVAFQGYSGDVAQSTGYMIPAPVMLRFLEDIKDGKYDHYVDLAVSDFPILNPALRRALGLPNNAQGIMIGSVNAEGSADGKLSIGDVLLEIDGYPIASNGSIDMRGEKVNMAEIVERKFAGDIIKLKVWRDKKPIDVAIELKRFLPYLISARQYEQRPEYVMYAGLVFQPLDRNMMSALKLSNIEVRRYFGYFVADELYKELPEVVVLTTVLPDAINTHIEGYAGGIVELINGQKILTLKDVLPALENEADKDFTVIQLRGQGRPLVLEKARVPGAQVRIMSKYGVREDHYVK